MSQANANKSAPTSPTGRQLRLDAAQVPDPDASNYLEELAELEGRILRVSAALEGSTQVDLQGFLRAWKLRCSLCGAAGSEGFALVRSYMGDDLAAFWAWLLEREDFDACLRGSSAEQRELAKRVWTALGQCILGSTEPTTTLVDRAMQPPARPGGGLGRNLGLAGNLDAEFARAELSGIPDRLIARHREMAELWDDSGVAARSHDWLRPGAPPTGAEPVRAKPPDYEVMWLCHAEGLRRGTMPHEDSVPGANGPFSLSAAVRTAMTTDGARPAGTYQKRYQGGGYEDIFSRLIESAPVDRESENDRRRQVRREISRLLDRAHFAESVDAWKTASRRRLKDNPSLDQVTRDAVRVLLWGDSFWDPAPARRTNLQVLMKETPKDALRQVDPGRYGVRGPSALGSAPAGGRYSGPHYKDLERDCPAVSYLLLSAIEDFLDQQTGEARSSWSAKHAEVAGIELNARLAYLFTARVDMSTVAGTRLEEYLRRTAEQLSKVAPAASVVPAGMTRGRAAVRWCRLLIQLLAEYETLLAGLPNRIPDYSGRSDLEHSLTELAGGFGRAWIPAAQGAAEAALGEWPDNVYGVDQNGARSLSSKIRLVGAVSWGAARFQHLLNDELVAQRQTLLRWATDLYQHCQQLPAPDGPQQSMLYRAVEALAQALAGNEPADDTTDELGEGEDQ